MNRTAKAEFAVLVGLLLVVGMFAGWASFTHVHDWTMQHMPPGTSSAFGWVNAVISELVPVACLLDIRRRRRAGTGVVYPLFLLLAAVSLSLAAQLAVANPSPSGWLLSAVPALAFMALVKLVLSGKPSEPALSPTSKPTQVNPVAETQLAPTGDGGADRRRPARPKVETPDLFISNGTPVAQLAPLTREAR